MATTTYGTEYVQSSDLVSNWPGSSLSVANRIDDVSLVGNGYNNQTGTSYTLVLADGGKLVTFSNAAAVSLTVPTNASVAFPIGVRIKLTNKGAGTVTVAGAGGVTLNGNQLTMAQNRSAMLYKLDTNTWVMTTDVSIPSDPGLAFITSSTFTTSAAVNVNNCFTSTYDNYRVVGNITGTASTTIGIRMRVGGVDNSTASSYIRERLVGDGSAAAAGMATDSQFIDVLAINTAIAPQTVEFLEPALAAPTGLIVVGGRDNQVHIVSGRHNQSTIYDGFSLIPVTGTITGTIRIFGYRNA